MKITLSFLFLLFINLFYASAQTKSDFSYNMVKVTDGRRLKEVPQYGFITGTDKTNESFYFVMIYPENMTPFPAVNIKYITEGLEKESVKYTRGTLIPYDGIVIIGNYRLVVYQAQGHTTIRRKYVQNLMLSNRDTHKIYINRTPNETEFVPDIFDPLVEMNTKHFDQDKDAAVKFRLQRKIPDVIASGYPVVDADGYLNGLIAAPNSNEDFDVISMFLIKRKLSAMTDDGYACKYFGLVFKGFEFTDCDDVFKKDSLVVAAEKNKKRYIRAVKENRNYPFAVGMKAGASGQYMNVGGTVSPGFGYYGGVDFYILPDTSVFSFSIRPRYGIYHYFPISHEYPQGDGISDYSVTQAKRKQLDLQFMAEIKFNRRLNGHNYIGFGYSRSFTDQADFRLTKPDGSNQHYILPEDKAPLHAYILEFGWNIGKVRYGLSTIYQKSAAFPVNYTLNIDNHVLSPFSQMKQPTLFLNFEIAFRLWGHWRNGIKG